MWSEPVGLSANRTRFIRANVTAPDAGRAAVTGSTVSCRRGGSARVPIAVFRDLRRDPDARLVGVPEVEPDQTRTSTISSIASETRVAAGAPRDVCVRPREPVGAEELLQGLPDRAAQAEVAGGMV